MIKVSGEAGAVTATPASPEQAINALNHLPDDEKVKVMDYLQSAMAITHNEPKGIQ